MFKRLAVSVCVAVGVVVLNLPMPALGSTPQPVGRVLINAPEMPAVDLTPPPLPAGAPLKQARPLAAGAANHVSALPASTLRAFQQAGMTVLTNRDGEWQFEATVNGEARIFTAVDGRLPSGREVVGFGTMPAPTATSQASLIRVLNVSANSVSFAICSYAWQNGFYGDLHVHLCSVDAAYISAIITLIGATVGGLVGVLMGNVAGGVAGVAIGTIVGLLTIVFFWTHSDAWGNVDFVVPNWTMQLPYGGYILWADISLWDYMPDQCWINDRGHYYAPRCSY